MTAFFSSRVLRSWGPGLVVAAAGLAASIWLARQQQAAGEAIAQVRFTEEARSSANAIAQRVAAYSEIVSGLRDLFLVHPQLSRAEFERVVAERRLALRYPEIRNLSFVRRVAAADLPAFEARLRAEVPRATLREPQGGWPDYYINDYVWPLEGNDGVVGLDITSQPANFAAMQAARTTGLPVLTAPFDLVQEREQPTGVILRVPVFTEGGRGAGDAQQGRFAGTVAATVRIHDMLGAVDSFGFLRGVALRMEDVGAVGDAANAPVPMAVPASPLSPSAQALREVRQLNVYGRRWLLTFTPSASQLSTAERQLPWWIGVGGAVLSLLLAALVTLLSRQRALALTEVQESHEALRTSEQRLRTILHRMPVGVCLVDKDGTIHFCNERYLQICGYTQAEAPNADAWWNLAFPDPQRRQAVHALWHAARKEAQRGEGIIHPIECELTGKDGQSRTVEVAGVELGDDHIVTMIDLSQRKAAEEEIRYLAFYDPLTQLPNRRLLLDQLRQALAASARRQRCGALLMLDLDNFKTLNETRGHGHGDSLLRQVAQRLRECRLENPAVARHGGDEFVVVLENLAASPEEAALRAGELGQKILCTLREPYLLEGEQYHTTVSMGIKVFQGQSDSVDELLKGAELAMYQAKAAGRNALQFYDPRMQAAVRARAALELDLRTGLAQGQFELFYQPQMDNGRINGCEVLLRWRHPRDGFVSPAAFVPLAEDTGLILPLGEWVLQTACQQLAAWAQQPALAHLSLAVNVSPRQFHQAGFVPQVLAALASTGADARRLKLELTEGLLLQDVEDTIEKMAQLKGYGVGFSLDDFGTGYSSLAYLKRLPLDQLKIDQSFVRDVLTDPNDAAIVRTILALAHSMDLAVVAEGVETTGQLEFLQRHGCQAFQGYLFGRPMPAEVLERALRPAL